MAKTETPAHYHWGVGRRKSAVAQVRLTPGTGQFTVNNTKVSPDTLWTKPLELVGKRETTDVSVIVRGGGMTGQQEAITLGIARAIIRAEAELKPTLRKAGLVTRDPRVKERMKPGLKRARKAPQWSKR
jgi:small subunit ribosomal protein S9